MRNSGYIFSIQFEISDKNINKFSETQDNNEKDKSKDKRLLTFNLTLFFYAQDPSRDFQIFCVLICIDCH